MDNATRFGLLPGAPAAPLRASARGQSTGKGHLRTTTGAPERAQGRAVGKVQGLTGCGGRNDTAEAGDTAGSSRQEAAQSRPASRSSGWVRSVSEPTAAAMEGPCK